MIMALTALAIDLMLPAFDDMREYFNLAPDSTQVAQVVTTFLLGTALAGLFYGPIADRFGRKPTLYLGFAIYGVGALGATLAPSLPLVLLFRFIWGIGAAGPRVVAISIVRDTYEGDEMSKAMSFIMAIFVTVPVLAPSVGALLVSAFVWQATFAFCVVAAAAMAIWVRVLPETLDPADRIPIDWRAISSSMRQVVTNRHTVGYAMAMTMTFGAFTSYLASSERIFGEMYDKPDQFPFIFGGLAAAMGAAILLNPRLVDRFGTRRIVHAGLIAFTVVSLSVLAVTLAASGKPGFWVLVAGLVLMLGLHGMLIPNSNTIAMLPMGHVAGTASAVIGTVSLAGGALIGSIIDRNLSSTVSPLVLGFAAMSTLALVWVVWAERGKLFTDTVATPATAGTDTSPTIPPVSGIAD